MDDHGGINRAVLTIFISLSLIIFMIYKALRKFYRSLKHKILFAVPFIVLIIWGLVIYNFKFKNS